MKLTGFSRTQCPAACNAERCIISERPHCAHPCMGGLQEALLREPDVVLRYTEACKALGLKQGVAA